MASPGSDKAPVLHGRGATFADYEHRAHLWLRTTKTELAARASFWVLRMQPAPRQVCLAEGCDILGHGDGVTRILDNLRRGSAPEAADAIRQQLARFTNYRRTGQSAHGYIAEFFLTRKKAESKMDAGAGFPEQFAPILRMRNAELSRYGKPLFLASCREGLKFEDASANMRRLFGSRGGGSRQDALSTAEAVEPRASDEDLDASAAYRKAKKLGAGKKKKDALPKSGGGKVGGVGQTLNGFNFETGLRNRRYRCDSEHHLAPRYSWRDTPRGDGSSRPQERDRERRPSFSSIPAETPVSTQGEGNLGDDGPRESGESCFDSDRE